MNTGAIVIMSFITIVFGFACFLVIDHEIREYKKKEKQNLRAKKLAHTKK